MKKQRIPSLPFLVMVFVCAGLIFWLYRQREDLFQLQQEVGWRSDMIACLDGSPLPDQVGHDSRARYLFDAPYFGLVYRGSCANYSGRSIFFSGRFESSVIGVLHNILEDLNLKTKAVVLDIGAYWGTHTLPLALWSKEVHSFEPNDVSMKALAYNVSTNQLKNVVLHPVGLGAREGGVDYFDSLGGGDIQGSFISEFGGNQRRKKQFRIVVGDEYLQEQGSPVVHLIKMDVEGYEGEVLRGLRNTMNSHRPVVVMEITPSAPTSFEKLEDLQAGFPAEYLFFRLSDIYKTSSAYSLEPLSSEHFLNEQIELLAVPSELSQKIRRSAGEIFGASR